MGKKHIGMRSSTVRIKKKFAPRLAHAWLGLGMRGGIHVFSTYGWTSEGMSARNLELLGEIARVTKLVKGPWIVGGDFNLAPEKMIRWANDNQAYVCCPEAPTCNLSTLDCFLVQVPRLSSCRHPDPH